MTGIPRRLLALSFGLAIITAACPATAGKARPFKGHVTAVWDNVFAGLFAPPANFLGGGPVTHMGNTFQTGTLFLLPPDENFVAPGFGSVTIIAANGDQLSFDYEGELHALTGEGIGTFTFAGGTGRFANVSGGGTFYALIDTSLPDNQPMTVELDGAISY